MSYDKARNSVQSCLLATLAIGGLTTLFWIAWIPAYEAATIDVILTPDELHDHKLIEVVHRTHRHNATRQGRLVAPYLVLGGLTMVAATIGLIALRGLPRPLVPGDIGMRVRETQ